MDPDAPPMLSLGWFLDSEIENMKVVILIQVKEQLIWVEPNICFYVLMISKHPFTTLYKSFMKILIYQKIFCQIPLRKVREQYFYDGLYKITKKESILAMYL